jgi:hypothetical protein
MTTMSNIQLEIRNILESIEQVPEEQHEELEDYLAGLGDLEAEKADAIAFVLREQKARIEFLKDEEKRIKARRNAAERGLERTKEYFKGMMYANGLKQIKGNSSTLFLRKSESVNLGENFVPELCLPEECYKKEVSIKIDRNKIKQKIKSGESIEGCSLVENFSLNVR